MIQVKVTARVDESGKFIELVEPLPEEYRTHDVRVIVEHGARSRDSDDPWTVLAIEAFFEDDEGVDDSIYDTL